MYLSQSLFPLFSFIFVANAEEKIMGGIRTLDVFLASAEEKTMGGVKSMVVCGDWRLEPMFRAVLINSSACLHGPFCTVASKQEVDDGVNRNTKSNVSSGKKVLQGIVVMIHTVGVLVQLVEKGDL